MVRPVEHFFWYLPPEPWKGPRAKPRLSTFKMDAEQAVKLGAIEPQLSSREVRMLPETPEEQHQAMSERATGARIMQIVPPPPSRTEANPMASAPRDGSAFIGYVDTIRWASGKSESGGTALVRWSGARWEFAENFGQGAELVMTGWRPL